MCHQTPIPFMPPPPIFTCPAAKALVVLILIENSHLILPFWNDLRQHYLPTLLGTMRIANPVIPIPVLWLTTAPVGDDPASLHSPPPRQYNQLPELKFSFTPDNKISSRIINRAVELMLEAATQFQGGPVSFHLFVVAASSPIHGTWGVSLTMPSQIGQSEWHLLGQRIAQLGIYCHMILPTSHNMSPLNELFSTSLHLQGHTLIPPWFPTPSEYAFLLSGDPSAPVPTHQLLDPSIDPSESVHSIPVADAPQSPLPVARPPVLRHQSFPQDVQSATTAPAQHGATPSLVSSLQKVHGLSRKKLYGAQPARQPFVREEPVRTKYKSTPTPLSIPVGAQPFLIPEDGRVLGKTKVDRGRHADRHMGDASTSCSPGRRNHASSSDVTSSPSSPTASLSSQHSTSPTIPLYPDPASYPASPPARSATFSPGIISSVPIHETNFSSPLCDPSGGYLLMPPPLQSPVIPVPSQGPMWIPTSKPPLNTVPMTKSAVMPITNRRHSQELPHSSHMQSLSAMSSKYRLDAGTEPRPTAKSTQKVKDAGDVPFIFSAELEAATAAKLKAALQSTTPVPTTMATNQFPAFTSGNQLSYAAVTVEDTYASSQPPLALHGYDTMQDACPTGLVNGISQCDDGERHARFVGSTTSSLHGWAG